MLVSLYFDDAHISDWKSSKGSGQAAFATLNSLLGTPFAQEKRQPMSAVGLFLGLDHDVAEALSSGVVMQVLGSRATRIQTYGHHQYGQSHWTTDARDSS